MSARACLLAGAAVLLTALAPVELARADVSGPQVRFAPPFEQLILSRTVIRELSDGTQIKVTRRYAVRFAPAESGFLLDGKLVDVSVDVPPLLNSLAEVERRREETGMFPVRIDSTGTILSGQGGGQADLRARDEMTTRATAVLAGTGMPSENLQLGTRFVSQALQAQPRSPWPVDLLRIPPGEHRQSRTVALAGGAEGRIEVVTRVDALLPCGLPSSIERTVVTLLAGTRRVSREIWTFQAGAL
ncbi:MAG: hypothetical protein K2W91_08415 [Novosphingobium sp.]|nr:hypothetical protein [Novosphingobium sp.]